MLVQSVLGQNVVENLVAAPFFRGVCLSDGHLCFLWWFVLVLLVVRKWRPQKDGRKYTHMRFEVRDAPYQLDFLISLLGTMGYLWTCMEPKAR